MPTLGNRLATLRKQKGLSQAELARLLGLGQSTIAMYERDKRQPDMDTLNRLADFFGVSADYLLGRADAPGRQLVAGGPFFDELIDGHPDLSEEERQALAEHLAWALKVIRMERERRNQRVERN